MIGSVTVEIYLKESFLSLVNNYFERKLVVHVLLHYLEKGLIRNLFCCV